MDGVGCRGDYNSAELFTECNIEEMGIDLCSFAHPSYCKQFWQLIVVVFTAYIDKHVRVRYDDRTIVYLYPA